MFSLLESKEEIKTPNTYWKSPYRENFHIQLSGTLAILQVGRLTHRICVYRESYWFWSGDYRGKGTPRRQNWFGLMRPGVLGITVEINVAYQSQSKNIAGYFARDSVSKSIYLMHSGKIGGGAKGVGKNAFLASSSPQLIKVSTLQETFD